MTCCICDGKYDFPCAGITEAGWRKLGERRNTWKCSNCKSQAAPSPRSQSVKSTPFDSEAIMKEIKRLSTQMEELPALINSVKAIQSELSELKLMRSEFLELKSSIEFSHDVVEDLSKRMKALEQEVEILKQSKEDINTLKMRIEKVEHQQHENEQRSRMNNIEIKGVPISSSENLFNIVAKIGEIIDYSIPKEQINYIARIPSRAGKQSKNIICSLHNTYIKKDFVAAAKKKKNLSANDLGLQGTDRIYVNDHLTLENKSLLNKTKVHAKNSGFEYVWVTGCKIFIRKNQTSPKHHIRNEQDLKKFFHV